MEETRQVYLDYSATTPVKREVLEAMLPYFTEFYGNPSSLYSIGQKSKDAINTARAQVAALIGAREDEIFFTGSGTETDNWAIIGAMFWKRNKCRHIIISNVEHHAILRSGEYIEKEGFDVTYLPVDSQGFVQPEALKKALRDDTALVSVMFANNEIGTIQPIKELAKAAHERGALFHTDAVQALGNVPIDVKKLGVDLMSMSAHKIYGPKGVGALFVKKGVNLPAYMQGGAQEKGKRAGTENVPGIVGFGKAAELAGQNLGAHIEELKGLRDYFLERVLNEIPDVDVNGSMESRLPGNLNISFKYIEGEALLLLLDLAGVSVSTGSACSSASLAPSHVLDALGLSVTDSYSSIRFTFGDFTTREDLDYAIEKLKTAAAKLREISMFSKNNEY